MCDDEIKDDESICSIIETDEIENNEAEYESKWRWNRFNRWISRFKNWNDESSKLWAWLD